MFNTARFNLQRFNLQSDTETDIEIRCVLDEIMHCFIGYGENARIFETLTEQINGKAWVDPGEHLSGVGAGNIKYKIDAYVEFFAQADFAEDILSDLYASQDSYLIYELAEDVDNFSYIGCDSWHSVSGAEKFYNYFWLSANRYERGWVLCEIYSCDVTTARFTSKTVVLNVTIPPGGELIIDSDNFTVMLNGVNAIHTHMGDWVTLCRNTYDLVVSMGQYAPFKAEMIYEERYL